MELLFTILLCIHITGGTIGLTTGTINMIRKKGDKKHRIIGDIFFYSMLAVGFSALGLSSIHTSYFLFIIGIFTIYLASTGKRYLYLRQLGSGQKPQLIDWLLTSVMMVFGLAFMVFGVLVLLQGNSFGSLFIFFGILSLFNVRRDFKNLRGKTNIQNIWMVAHLQKMVGCWIAALTAFIVVNVHFMPDNLFFVPWILPTVIFFPLIIKWTRKYGKIKKLETTFEKV